MILVDTSIWVDHLRSGNTTLARLLEAARVLAHPFAIGEIALGHLRQRNSVLDSLVRLPHPPPSGLLTRTVLGYPHKHARS